ncbi:MFS transporter [Streptomyces sp. NPDC002446]
MARAARPASLFRDRNFSSLIVAQFVSDTGTAVSALALPLVALTQLHATPLLLGVLGAASALPQLFLSLWAGALADRGDKRRMMLYSDAVRCLLVLTVPVAALLHRLTFLQVLLVALGEAAITLLFDAAYSSYPPQLFQDSGRLEEALGKLNASFSAALLIGPSLAGVLVASVNASNAIIGDAASYAISFFLLLRIRVTRHKGGETRGGVDGGTGGGVDSGTGLFVAQREGLKYLFAHTEFRSIALANGVDSFFLAGWNALWLLYVVRHLHWSAQAAGFVLGIGAVGGVLGSLLARRATKKFGISKVLIVSAFVTAPCEAVTLIVAPGLVGQIAVLVSFIVVMFFVFLYTTAARAYRQTTCPLHMLGRVMMASRWLSWGGRPVGAFFGGLAGSFISVRSAMFLAVLGLLVPPLILLVGLRGRHGTTVSQEIPENAAS